MFTARPIEASATGAIPSSVPRPTAISTSATARPVSSGACPARRRSEAMGLPWPKAFSWFPMKSGVPEWRKFASASFWMPA